jgi:hypothetical protein
MSFVNTAPNPFAGVTNTIPSGGNSQIVGGTLFASSVGKLPFFIQVVGSGGPLFVAYSNQAAGTGNFSAILKPATSTYGADGGTLFEQAYTGPVQVSGSVECRFIYWQNGRAT